MHITLHLTDRCNMRCKYCYNEHGVGTMMPEVAHRAVDLAFEQSNGKACGIVFFGGEPLICRDLIYDTVDYANASADGRPIYFKLTTNGTLLDEDFIDYAVKNKVFIAISHDGVREAHDASRVFADGRGSFDVLAHVLPVLLKRMPYTPVLMTVTPENSEYFSAGVEYLYSQGFRYIIVSVDYTAAWDDALLYELRKQYRLLAEFYRRHTLAEDKFYLSPFEVKMSSHIHGENYRRERCELGKKQLSVAPDGSIYPCVQFVGFNDYRIGSVFDGIDERRRRQLYDLSESEREECAECSIKSRCNSHCGCLNFRSTGSVSGISPVLCEHERMLTVIADRLAENLFRHRAPMFMQKHYNDMFPVLSLIEDKLGGAPKGFSPFVE